jgi:hypothetical protein
MNSYEEKADPIKSVPCAVSKEFLDFVAGLNPVKLKHNGKTKIPETLFLCGFKIDSGYTIYKDVLIRNPSMPSKVYSTTVYNGRVRDMVDEVDLRGKITYQKGNPHYMKKLYVENEVLTLHNLDPEFMESISNIGNINWYNEGFKAMDKRVEGGKVPRNIVNK